MTLHRCRICGALWVQFSGVQFLEAGSWSLLSPIAMMGKCCDNSSEFLSLLDRLLDNQILDLIREAEQHRFALREKASGK